MGCILRGCGDLYSIKMTKNGIKKYKMKRIAILMMVMGAAMASCQQKNNESEIHPTMKVNNMEKQEKQKIEALLSEYEKSLNTSDAKLAQSLYAKDGMFMPTEAPTAIGADSILAAYQHVFSQIQLSIQFMIEEVQVEGSMAFAVTSSKGTTLIHATGDTVPEANRELFVFEKIEGEWKIARYMFNKTEPRQ